MYKDLIDKIKEYETIVIARHIGVDPDALCSQLALRDSIKLTYPDKKVLAIGTGSSKYLRVGKLDKIESVENALLIVCDTPDKRRVDSVKFEEFNYLIKIDHHPFVEKFCDLEIIDDSKTSACELLMEIIKVTELKCNNDIAQLLYMGLAADSNRFLFDSTTANTFYLVAEYLEKYPFSLSDGYSKIYMRPLSEVRLEGYIASNMVVNENGLGYIIIDNNIIEQYEVDSASAGNLVNEFNFIKEMLVWATITEDIKNKQYRVSVRSRGPVINTVLEKNNGGGHKYASGARVKTKEEALKIMDDLNKELIEYKNNMSEEK